MRMMVRSGEARSALEWQEGARTVDDQSTGSSTSEVNAAEWRTRAVAVAATAESTA